jgi:hypothetical protein
MLPTELTDYICGVTTASVGSALAIWMVENASFHEFVERYRDKIRAKLRRSKSDSDLQDLLWELEIGYLISKNPHFLVEYEPYGTANSRSPDYRITDLGRVAFNVEARRIREGASQSRFEVWEEEIKDAIHSVPSQLGVTLSIRVMDPSPDLLNQLELHRYQMIAEIKKRIAQENVLLAPGQSCCHQMPGFEKTIGIKITKPRSKANPNQTAYYGSTFPIWHTQKEFAKFGDIVCEKLGQLRSGMPNVLAIGSRSITHDYTDCEDAIGELTRLAKEQDDAFFRKKGFGGEADFSTQVRNLSAIVFRSSWRGDTDRERNFVWRNPVAAYPLDEDSEVYLNQMDSAGAPI